MQVDEKSLPSVARKGVTASRGSDSSRADLPRDVRLLRRSEYDAVYRESRRRSSREFAIFLRSNGLPFSRFGWSVKKALGTAVRRNRIRRRLREIVRLHRHEVAPGWDVVIHPRSSVASSSFSALAEELLRLLPHRE